MKKVTEVNNLEEKKRKTIRKSSDKCYTYKLLEENYSDEHKQTKEIQLNTITISKTE